MSTAIISLVLINTTILGFAFFFKKILNLNHTFKLENIDFLWGYFILIALSLSVNFFYPLKNLSFFVLITGNILFLVSYYKKFYEINFISLLAISIFLIFISKNHVIAYDSQLYHLQTIQLNFNFPVIFGIANLQAHYGMNSGWHNFLSLINLEIGNQKLVYLGNISLFSFYLNELFKRNFFLEKKLSDVFLLISVCFIFFYSYLHPAQNGTILSSLGSPEVDTVSMVFYIFCIYILIQFFEKESSEKLSLLLISIFLTVTTKIGYISIIFIYIYLFFIKKISFSNKVNFFALFIGFVWLIKNFILSSCLIFPIKYTCIKTSWSMEQNMIAGFSNVIQSFARDTPERLMFSNFEYTLYSMDWFNPWLFEYFFKTEFLYISFLIILFNLIIISIVLLFYKNLFPIQKKNFFLIILIFLLSLYIWFKAPEIRFGYGTIISFVSFTCSIVFLFYFKNINSKIFLYISVLLVFMPLIIKNIDNINTLDKVFSNRHFNTDLDVIYTSNNIKVYKPNKSVFCNDANVFCTYQGFKVNIFREGRYILMSKD